jgi:hypothetical protein
MHTAAHAHQVGGVPGLHVLGEHQDAGAGMVATDRDRGAQPLVGVVRRHPHVDDRHVRLVLGDRGLQRLGVADRGDDLVPAVGEDLGESRSDHGGVLGDDDAQNLNHVQDLRSGFRHGTAVPRSPPWARRTGCQR